MGAGQRGISLLVWTIVFTVVITCMLGARFWAARIAKRSFFLDDAFIILAYMNTICLSGAAIWAVFNGLGKHTNELTTEEMAVQFKLIIISNVNWTLATVFVKISILWLYKRIFVTRGFKLAAVVMIFVCAAYGIAFFIEFLTSCHPVSYHWDPVPGGGCRDISIDEITSVSLNIVIDVIIVALPMMTIWGLKMPTQNKIYVSVLFSMGILTISIMCWRLQVVLASAADPDFVYGLAKIGLIALLELWVGIIVSCLLTSTPLLTKKLGPILTRLGQTLRNLRDSSASKNGSNRRTGAPNGQTTRPSRKNHEDITNISASNSSYSLNPYKATGNTVTTACAHEDDFEMLRISTNEIHVTQEITRYDDVV